MQKNYQTNEEWPILHRRVSPSDRPADLDQVIATISLVRIPESVEDNSLDVTLLSRVDQMVEIQGNVRTKGLCVGVVNFGLLPNAAFNHWGYIEEVSDMKYGRYVKMDGIRYRRWWCFTTEVSSSNPVKTGYNLFNDSEGHANLYCMNTLVLEAETRRGIDYCNLPEVQSLDWTFCCSLLAPLPRAAGDDDKSCSSNRDLERVLNSIILETDCPEDFDFAVAFLTELQSSDDLLLSPSNIDRLLKVLETHLCGVDNPDVFDETCKVMKKISSLKKKTLGHYSEEKLSGGFSPKEV